MLQAAAKRKTARKNGGGNKISKLNGNQHHKEECQENVVTSLLFAARKKHYDYGKHHRGGVHKAGCGIHDQGDRDQRERAPSVFGKQRKEETAKQYGGRKLATHGDDPLRNVTCLQSVSDLNEIKQKGRHRVIAVRNLTGALKGCQVLKENANVGKSAGKGKKG